MIKVLKKYQIQVTPFESTKDWSLNNTDNNALLLYESTGSDDGLPYALEFLDYSQSNAFDNNNCDIALEQQTGGDLITIDEGLKITGLFYPDTDPKNDDGNYKRMVYSQIKTTFYNTYHDPTKIWGLENIDFELSKTKRMLSDRFRLFYIPQVVFGDKITPNTLVMTDNTFDNNYTIIDDGNGNLIAGTNLFSHQQEVGNYINNFYADQSSSYCNYYWPSSSFVPGPEITIITPPMVVDYPLVNFGIYGGSITNYPLTDYPLITLGFTTGSIFTTVLTSSFYESSSVTLGFTTGSIFTTVITSSLPYESSSVTLGFTTGSMITTVIVESTSPDSSSVLFGFYSGFVM